MGENSRFSSMTVVASGQNGSTRGSNNGEMRLAIVDCDVLLFDMRSLAKSIIQAVLQRKIFDQDIESLFQFGVPLPVTAETLLTNHLSTENSDNISTSSLNEIQIPFSGAWGYTVSPVKNMTQSIFSDQVWKNLGEKKHLSNSGTDVKISGLDNGGGMREACAYLWHMWRTFSPTCKPHFGAVRFIKHLQESDFKVILATSNKDVVETLRDLHPDWLGKCCIFDCIEEIENYKSGDLEVTKGLVFAGTERFAKLFESSGFGNVLRLTGTGKNALTSRNNVVDESADQDRRSSQPNVWRPIPLELVDWELLSCRRLPEFKYPLKVAPLEVAPVQCPERGEWNRIVLLSTHISITGKVVEGFGRGSHLLGIPTANVNPDHQPPSWLLPGVYFGWGTLLPSNIESCKPPNYKMVMSVGYNPYFDNAQITIEPFFFHKFNEPFVGQRIALAVMGFIRSEADFCSLGQLVQAIQNDCELAAEVLDDSRVVHLFPLHLSNGAFSSAPTA